MRNSIRDIPKKRGRPKTTGRGEGILIRLHAPQLVVLDSWIARQSDSPSRPEAIRRIVGRALGGRSVRRAPNKGAARKASELAVREIERVAPRSVPTEEKQRRKRTLIRGPREFRQIREDLPKPKS